MAKERRNKPNPKPIEEKVISVLILKALPANPRNLFVFSLEKNVKKSNCWGVKLCFFSCLKSIS